MGCACMLLAFADSPSHRMLALPGGSRLKEHSVRTRGLSDVSTASDKPSDNDPRQHQTEGDALRHR